MFRQTTLKNGLTILSEEMASIQTVSVGAYIRTGARHENPQINGLSHMLEHMAFKGTKRRSALDIAAEVEGVGGVMNAYTSYETTVYYLKTLADDLPLAVDILGDILLHSTFPENEIEVERGVILQEIGQSKDAPDDQVFELVQTTAWPTQPLGRPILGTVETVNGLKRQHLADYMAHHYRAGNMVIAAAGKIDHDHLVQLVEKYFAGLKAGAGELPESASYQGGLVAEHRPLEQVHFSLGFEAIPYGDPAYYTAHLWNTLLGGGMASRLFQEVREKRGLVYSVYSYIQNYRDTGMFGIYAGTGAQQLPELIPVLRDVLHEATQQLTTEEIERARTQLKAGLMMSLESTSSRMSRLASNHFIYGGYVPLEDTISKIDAVSKTDLLAIGQRLFHPKTATVAAVGPVDEAALQKLWAA